MSKRKVSVEDKIYAVNLYLDGKESQQRIAHMFDVSLASVQQWIRNYESMGSNAFTLKGNKKYSKELKQQAVLDYLAGYGSQDDICKKYGIRSKGKLQTWIKKYNGHEELKSSGTGGNIIMTKGRKTTFEERVEIVNFTIAHDKDYQAAIEKYGISYQQVYSWVRKFEKDGSQGLLDRRGKGLDSKPNLTPEEELQLKIKQLEERNHYLEMEVGLLKKLEEIRRRNRR